jgi:hypothetical protein
MPTTRRVPRRVTDRGDNETVRRDGVERVKGARPKPDRTLVDRHAVPPG